MKEEEILKKHISLMEDGEETLKRFEEWKQCDFAKAVFAAMQECAAQQNPAALPDEGCPSISTCIDAEAPYEDMSAEVRKGFDFCMDMVKHFESTRTKKEA